MLGIWALLVRNLRAMGTEWSYCVEEATEGREGEKSKPDLAQHDLKSSKQGYHLLLILGSCLLPLPISLILPI